jgi:hypothetical protein
VLDPCRDATSRPGARNRRLSGPLKQLRTAIERSVETPSSLHRLIRPSARRAQVKHASKVTHRCATHAPPASRTRATSGSWPRLFYRLDCLESGFDLVPVVGPAATIRLVGISFRGELANFQLPHQDLSRFTYLVSGEKTAAAMPLDAR